MNKLRKALLQLYEESVKRRLDSHAGLQAQAERVATLEAFVGEKPFLKNAMARMMNGDYAKEEIEHHCAGQSRCPSSKDTLRTVKWIVGQLTKRAIRLFPRSNWLGAEACVDAIGILMVHKLLPRAVVLGFGLEIGRSLVIDETFHVNDNDVAEEQAALDETAAVRQENAKRDNIVCGFLGHIDFLVDLAFARKMLTPQVVLMRSFLAMASRGWELKQLAKAMDGQDRKHQVLEHHHGAAASRFFATLLQLFLKESVFRVSASRMALTFQQLARAGAVAYRLLRCRHRNYPYKTFRLLDDTDLEFLDEFCRAPSCVLDSWTASWRSRVLGEDAEEALTQDTLQKMRAEFLALASLACTDTVSTEKAHASNLRRLKSQIHTQAVSLPELAAWQALRSSVPFFHQNTFSKPKAAAKDEKDEPVVSVATPNGQQKKFRRLSAWRAFVSSQTRSAVKRSADQWGSELSVLAEQYAELDPEEKQRYKHLASVMAKPPRRPVAAVRARAEAADAQARVQKALQSADPLALRPHADAVTMSKGEHRHLQMLARQDSVSLHVPSSPKELCGYLNKGG